ncbi:MAG: hypothetical protein AB7H80_07855 [Candidatus Kapaibacterium sp.]
MKRLLPALLSLLFFSCSFGSGKLEVSRKGSATLIKTIYPSGFPRVFSGSEGKSYMVVEGDVRFAAISPTLESGKEWEIKGEPGFMPIDFIHIGDDKFLVLLGDVGDPTMHMPVIGTIDGIIYDGVTGKEGAKQRLVDLGKDVLIYAGVRQSPDQRHLAITTWKSGWEGGVRISTTFFDRTLQTLSKSVEQEYPVADPGTNVYDVLIPNEGGTLVIRSTGSERSATLSVDYAGGTAGEVTTDVTFPPILAEDDVAIGGIAASITGEHELTVATGLFNDDNLKGLYLTRLNYTTGTIISHDSLLLDHAKARELTKRKNLPHVKPTQIIVSENGTIYVAAEAEEVKKISTTKYTEMKGLKSTYVYEQTYGDGEYYRGVLGDMFLFSFSSEGKYQWGERMVEKSLPGNYIQVSVWEARPYWHMHDWLRKQVTPVTLRNGKCAVIYNAATSLHYTELSLDGENRSVKHYPLIESSGMSIADQSTTFWQNDSTLLVGGFTGLFSQTYYLMQLLIP